MCQNYYIVYAQGPYFIWQILLVASCLYSVLPSSQGPHISVQCTAVNIRFSHAILTERAGNSFLLLTDISRINKNIHFIMHSAGQTEDNTSCELSLIIFSVKIVIIIIRYGCLLSQAFLPGTSLEPSVIPTAQASSFTLQYFPYYVWCSKYSCLL